MRVIIQRVKSAEVEIAGKLVNKIGQGFLLYVGVHDSDDQETVKYMARKISRMRIFADEEGKTNLSIHDAGGDILSISQFTLYARTRKGNRPSFTDAAEPSYAKQLYVDLNDCLRAEHHLTVREGEFGANMAIKSINDGPFTIILDSQEN